MMIRKGKKKTEGQTLSDGRIHLSFRCFGRSLSSLWIRAAFGENVGRQLAMRYRMCH